MSGQDESEIEEEFARARPTWGLLRRTARFARPYRRALLAALAMEVVWCLSYAAGPHLVKRALDDCLAPGALGGLLAVCAMHAANTVLRAAWVGGELRLITRATQRILGEIRQAVFDHVQRLSMRFFDRTRQGRIIARVDRDVDSLEFPMVMGPVDLVSTVCLLALGIGSMAHYDGRLTLVVLACIPTLALSSEVFRRAGLAAYRRSRTALSRVTAHFAETVNGVREIQAFGQERRHHARAEGLVGRFRGESLRALRIAALYLPSVSLHDGIVSAAILLYGGSLVARQELSIGELVAFLLLAKMVFEPIESLGGLYNEVLSASASLERIFQVLDTQPEIRDRDGAVTVTGSPGGVELRQVRFRYGPDLPWVLGGASLAVAPGEMAALVGPTGAGKSSIVGLVCRFYEAQEGEVLVGGRDVREMTIGSLRRLVGIVPQDGYLFSGTIMENLRFGSPGAEDAEIISAARELGAHGILEGLPKGYETPVGERGGKLSHGQRQVVCYVRALLARPSVLILDEATSAMDAATEGVLQEALARLARGRTTLVVAHRLSTIRSADRIFVVEEGRISEEGIHAELMAAGGRYAGLYGSYRLSESSAG